MKIIKNIILIYIIVIANTYANTIDIRNDSIAQVLATSNLTCRDCKIGPDIISLLEEYDFSVSNIKDKKAIFKHIIEVSSNDSIHINLYKLLAQLHERHDIRDNLTFSVKVNDNSYISKNLEPITIHIKKSVNKSDNPVTQKKRKSETKKTHNFPIEILPSVAPPEISIIKVMSPTNIVLVTSGDSLNGNKNKSKKNIIPLIIKGIDKGLSQEQLLGYLQHVYWIVRKSDDTGYVVTATLRLAGGEDTDIQGQKISFSGVYTKDIYDQSELQEDATDDNKIEHLLQRKKQSIDENFEINVAGITAYAEKLSNEKGWPSDIIKGWMQPLISVLGTVAAGSVAGKVTAVAVGANSSQFFSNDVSTYDKMRKELESQVQKLNKNCFLMLKDINEEPIANLEQRYIVNKCQIPRSLQDSIESKLITYRNDSFQREEKINYINNALELPTKHRIIDLNQAIAAFENSPFFASFEPELREKIRTIIVKMSMDSQTDLNELELRNSYYFHGLPGTGKSSAAREIAKILGLPYFEITINSTGQLSNGEAKGNRAWNPSVGWLGQALTSKNKKHEKFTNPILILNDYDRVLFSPSGPNLNISIPGAPSPSNEDSAVQPDIMAMSFLLELADTDTRDYLSGYFGTKIPINRFNIFITANTPLPKSIIPHKESLKNDSGKDKSEESTQNSSTNVSAIKSNPFAALLSRVDTVEFTGFQDSTLHKFTHDYLELLIQKYHLVSYFKEDQRKDELIQTAINAQKALTGEDNLELRDLKRQMEKLVLSKFMTHNLKTNTVYKYN